MYSVLVLCTEYGDTSTVASGTCISTHVPPKAMKAGAKPKMYDQLHIISYLVYHTYSTCFT